MIAGILNSNTPLDLNKSSLEKYEILEVNYSNKEIILFKDQNKFKCKILKHNYEDQSYVVKVNGNISTIRIIKPAEKTAEKIGINKNTGLNVNTLKAPMPGLILEILVTKSVTVKKGDPIIILEAMKMENILTSPIDGVIKNIEVKPQQTVEKNNVLIRFES